ncbi:hypothetical protein BJY52DRAFT_1227448 [Lactarius psammicola]|nr:hypothetical protein BJY52DRAFT_1227448 [Lactarius psammicola]
MSRTVKGRFNSMVVEENGQGSLAKPRFPTIWEVEPRVLVGQLDSTLSLSVASTIDIHDNCRVAVVVVTVTVVAWPLLSQPPPPLHALPLRTPSPAPFPSPALYGHPSFHAQHRHKGEGHRQGGVHKPRSRGISWAEGFGVHTVPPAPPGMRGWGWSSPGRRDCGGGGGAPSVFAPQDTRKGGRRGDIAPAEGTGVAHCPSRALICTKEGGRVSSEADAKGATTRVGRPKGGGLSKWGCHRNGGGGTPFSPSVCVERMGRGDASWEGANEGDSDLSTTVITVVPASCRDWGRSMGSGVHLLGFNISTSFYRTLFPHLPHHLCLSPWPHGFPIEPTSKTVKFILKPIQAAALLTTCAHDDHDSGGHYYLNHDHHITTAHWRVSAIRVHKRETLSHAIPTATSRSMRALHANNEDSDTAVGVHTNASGSGDSGHHNKDVMTMTMTIMQ